MAATLAHAQTPDSPKRFPQLTLEQLNDEQRKLGEEILKVSSVGLGGPYNPMLRSPLMADRLFRLLDYLRFNTSLPRRLNEFAILIQARLWMSQVEWYSHYPLAIRAGLSEATAADLKAGRRPASMQSDEAVVYDFGMELSTNHAVSDATFKRAREVMTDQQIVDLATVSGTYVTVAMLLNMAEEPAPAGQTLLEPLASGQTRMPPLPAEALTEAQKKAVAEFKTARGADPTGPFLAMLRSPDVMTRARAMGDYLRFNSVLPPRLSEFVILITAREWTQQYEWGVHAPIALNAGVEPETVNAIAQGRRPEHMTDAEQILYDFCVELHRNQSVSDATHARAVSRFGEQGVIDTLGINGYYSMLAMVLNTNRTPADTGAPTLAPFPR
jgi:4-carboxymuconolactone decarboxylase